MKENMNSEPLLFIDTVNNEDVIPKNQFVYDSRYKQSNKIRTNNHDTEFFVKINRLVFMYNKNKKIICKVTLLSNEEYLVIVTSFNNNILNCIHKDNNEKLLFNINDINELTIEEIH